LTGGDKGEGEGFQDPLTPALSREGRGKFGKSPLPRRGEGVSSIDNPVPTRGQGLAMTCRFAAGIGIRASGNAALRRASGLGLLASGFGIIENTDTRIEIEGA